MYTHDGLRSQTTTKTSALLKSHKAIPDQVNRSHQPKRGKQAVASWIPDVMTGQFKPYCISLEWPYSRINHKPWLTSALVKQSTAAFYQTPNGGSKELVSHEPSDRLPLSLPLLSG